MSFARAASERDVWEGEPLACAVGRTAVMLVRVQGVVRAYEDRCAHLGFPLTKGILEGCALTCRAHHWKYDLRTGCGINPKNARLRSYPVKVEAGEVYVDTEEARDALP